MLSSDPQANIAKVELAKIVYSVDHGESVLKNYCPTLRNPLKKAILSGTSAMQTLVAD